MQVKVSGAGVGGRGGIRVAGAGRRGREGAERRVVASGKCSALQGVGPHCLALLRGLPQWRHIIDRGDDERLLAIVELGERRGVHVGQGRGIYAAIGSGLGQDGRWREKEEAARVVVGAV